MKVVLVLTFVCFFTILPAQSIDFVRGDCDGNGRVTMTDAVTLTDVFFLPGIAYLPCWAACDANDENVFVGIEDGILILNAKFIMGAPLPDPPFDPNDPTTQSGSGPDDDDRAGSLVTSHEGGEGGGADKGCDTFDSRGLEI